MQNREAVSIALVRNPDTSPEFFLVKRNPKLKFFGDYYAFPGGTLDDADHTISVESPGLLPAKLHPYIVAAVREVFEETGILPAEGQQKLTPAKKRSYRNALLNDEITFHEMLADGKLTVSAKGFRFLGEILTPEFTPVRYDTKFFLAQIPAGQSPEIIEGELVAGDFYTPARAIAEWKAGNLDIVPPVIFMFLHLATHSFEAALERIYRETKEYAAGQIHQIYFSPGIRMAPIKTKPLPPAGYTNCYIIGEKRLFLLDPGASDPDEQKRLLDFLDSVIDENHRPEAVLLSHHHPDHVDAAVLCSSRYGLPIYAHRYTANKLPYLQFGRLLNHGDELDLGETPDGKNGWKLEIFHTPGHAPGHLVFRESRYGALLAGDMVSTLSTIVIDPDEGGDMAEYMKSLDLMAQMETGIIYPAHGPAVKDGKKLIRQYIEHRKQRELKILQKLSDIPITSAELVQQVYDDVDASIRPLAEKSLRASLDKLIHEKKCKKTSEGYNLKM